MATVFRLVLHTTHVVPMVNVIPLEAVRNVAAQVVMKATLIRDVSQSNVDQTQIARQTGLV